MLLLRPQVNSAGILPLEWTRDAFDRCLSTNVAGPVMLTEQLLPQMQQGGTVVMVSSGEEGRWMLAWRGRGHAGRWWPRLTAPVCCMPQHAQLRAGSCASHCQA
jgi:NAD(P)-dependent dehydrogenase (short-subunit alcohol dehydrogenase family)